MPISPALPRPRKTHIARVLLAGSLLLAQSAPALAERPKPASKQNEATHPEVTELMQTAMARYAKNDLEGAREAFQRAWDLRQHAAIAASLGEVELKLGRYRDAAQHLSFYLAHLPPGKETMRTEAEQQLAECKRHVGTVKVSVEPSDAMVLVDGSAVAEGPQELLLEPGAHSLQAVASGRLSPKESFSIAAGETRQTMLVIVPAPTATPPPAAGIEPARERPTPAPQPAAESSDTKFWVEVGGATAAAVGVALGVTFTLKSNRASSHADELLGQIQSESDPKLVASGSECTATPTPRACAAYSQARIDTKQAKNIAIGSFIGGGVLALATVGTLALWPAGKHTPKSGQLLLSPYGGWRAPGLALHGTF
jgi:hypothetical protein